MIWGIHCSFLQYWSACLHERRTVFILFHGDIWFASQECCNRCNEWAWGQKPLKMPIHVSTGIEESHNNRIMVSIVSPFSTLRSRSNIFYLKTFYITGRMLHFCIMEWHVLFIWQKLLEHCRQLVSNQILTDHVSSRAGTSSFSVRRLPWVFSLSTGSLSWLWLQLQWSLLPSSRSTPLPNSVSVYCN